jgi:hypothetical protein
MLKGGHAKLLPCLVKLFNLCFSSGYYPDTWSNGYISPIFKSDDPADPNNYRGITITSNLGKVFNNVLNTGLDSFLTEHNLIHVHPSQVGFTKHARTSDHCFIVKCLIDKYCSTKEGRLYACFIDFHKAFDCHSLWVKTEVIAIKCWKQILKHN